MRVKIFAEPLTEAILNLYENEDNDYIIAVDHACLTLKEKNIPIDLAIGDFDSVTKDERKEIESYAKETELYKAKKDYTDTYLAVTRALYIEHDEITLYGGVGKRLDHTLANLDLLLLGNISIQTDDALIYTLDPGQYTIENGFDFISFFALEDVKNLSLSGFKYPLTYFNLDRFDPLCVSNEGEGNIAFDEGCLLVIHQNEKST
ncbi:MAG: thiamine diphosphokinase [Candidatus Izemoplasma sp.]|nr:thiamine diphosphokinase [Candidatus Izemoplasma sp.]